MMLDPHDLAPASGAAERSDPPGPCPLCGACAVRPFFADERRAYLRCDDCQLTFVPQRYWLSRAAERAVYDQHQNEVSDPGYRRFLSRLSAPLLERLPDRLSGLDFGCGPGPALAALLEEAGHRVALFDPFYHNHPEVLEREYDFICTTEVVEHLQDPRREFTRLFRLLKPGGWLGIMTKQALDRQAFSRWHYIRDPTHICFYHRQTFGYLARHFGAELHLIDRDVVLLHKG